VVDTKYIANLGLNSFVVEAKKNQNPLDVPFIPRLQATTQGIVKKLISYDVRENDFLRRIFEEAYLGENLFTTFWNVPSVSKFKNSLLEKETVIPSKDTLNFLQSKYGRFLIYSEKPRIQGIYLLENNSFKEYFDEDQSIFQDEMLEAEANAGGDIHYGKPDPTCFIKLAESLKNGLVVYVGDSIADAIMINNARSKGLSNILFFGVLCSTIYPEALFAEFVKHGADAIMTNINDIFYLINQLERKT
jgi:phosphoglycolate phosphatase-like HAD superfamily hydrolase